MAQIKSEIFAFLNDPKIEATLFTLYRKAWKQRWSMLVHYLPKVFKWYGNGIDWKTEKESFYTDKYIPIFPAQGAFLYMQARAINAQNIIEFGSSFGISTIYLAKAAKDNGGKVISTEIMPHKVDVARKNIADAGLSDYAEIWLGDARETLKNIAQPIDFVLLDGWPNLVFSIFKILEPHLKKGSIIIVDDVQGFKPSMQDYLDYIRNSKNAYLSTTIHPKKAMEFTIKLQ